MSNKLFFRIFLFIFAFILQIFLISVNETNAQSCGGGQTTITIGCDSSCKPITTTLTYTCMLGAGNICYGGVSDNGCFCVMMVLVIL